LFIIGAGEFLPTLIHLNPIIVFLLNQRAVSGCVGTALLAHEPVGANIFAPNLINWIVTFYAVAVVQNGLTTGLITYKIWKTARKSSDYIVGPNYLTSLLRIMIESAALYFAIELALFCVGISKSDVLTIVQDIIPSIVVCQPSVGIIIDDPVADNGFVRELPSPSSPSV
jgi:hypothetical protein